MRLRQMVAQKLAALPLSEWAPRFLPNHFSLPPSEMHHWLAERLEALDTGERLAVIAARDSAKSTWMSLALPLYRALNGQERYILLVAETEDQAQRYLRALRVELESNELLQLTYGKAATRGGQWNAERIILGNGVEIEAVGTGTAIRGRKNLDARPTLVIVDDPQNRMHVASAQARETHWSWFTQDLLNVGTNETNILVAGTALHREALVDRLTREPGWETRTFPAIVQSPSDEERWRRWKAIYTNMTDEHRVQTARTYYLRNRQAMDAGAVVCWPERESLYTLMRMKIDLGETAFAAEKQGQPVSSELCEWPPDYFSNTIWFDNWPLAPLVKTIALDPSKGTDARTGDYSAYVMLAVDKSGTLYVDADLERRTIERLIADGVVHYSRFVPHCFACEANAWQHLLGEQFTLAFAAAGLAHARTELIDNHQPKLLRIRLLGKHLAAGGIRFKRGSPGAELLVQQLRDFPVAAHDDGPDALQMAIQLAEQLLRPPRNDGLGGYLRVG
ncbi:MAG: hypothetical protein MPJ50_04490 [Pirellulales bacterium]|nr:hypothetical protein [Pirellulales bacterium]